MLRDLRFFLIAIPAFTLVACPQAGVERRNMRTSQLLATLRIPALVATDLDLDSINLELTGSDPEDLHFQKTEAVSDSDVSMSVPPGTYQVTLNYLAGENVVLSNEFCAKKTKTFTLKPLAEAETNLLPISLCLKGQADPLTDTSMKESLKKAPSGRPKLSGFTPGINVAWVNFARDVGTGSPNTAEITVAISRMPISRLENCPRKTRTADVLFPISSMLGP